MGTNGLINLTGNTNINLKENTETSQRYIEMLNNLDFGQNVTQQMKKGKKIIDQISFKTPLKNVYTNVIICPSISD